MAIVNTRLLKNPANWVIVLLMLVIAGIAGHLALAYFGVAPAEDTSTKTVPEQITPSTSPVNLKWDGTFNPTPVG